MFEAPDEVSRVVGERFGRSRVLVLGDLMLDVYLSGDVVRICPEAPVPVVRLQRRSAAPGGSGNVLLNLAGLGLEAVAAGYVGDDDGGRRLVELLSAAGVETRGVVTLADRPTTTKTRVVSGQHQMLRLDEEGTGPVDGSARARLAGAFRARLDEGVAAVILSDYAKGVLTDDLCRLAIDEGRRRGVPVLVDPKGRSFARYAGATALTPNLQEFSAAVGLDHPGDAEILDHGRRLRDDLGLDFLVVTCGAGGIRTVVGDALTHHPAAAREVFDVSGAGDTVIATLTAALAAGLHLGDAVRLANLAAGVVVTRKGTTPVRRDELLDAVRDGHLALRGAKVCDAGTIGPRLAEWRARGERVVFTNGCFDLLHVGHVTLLARARREGDRLVVGLNTDRSVRALKGPGRPVVTQDDRAQVLAGLSSVDAVILFDEETPLRLIELVRPDVLIKGGDYQESRIVGADLVRSWGGKVATVPLVEGRSTTRILDRSRNDPDPDPQDPR